MVPYFVLKIDIIFRPGNRSLITLSYFALIIQVYVIFSPNNRLYYIIILSLKINPIILSYTLIDIQSCLQIFLLSYRLCVYLQFLKRIFHFVYAILVHVRAYTYIIKLLDQGGIKGNVGYKHFAFCRPIFPKKAEY